VIAVDGKALRGFGGDRQPARHLLAALDHAHGVVLGQAGVGAKTKRNPLFTRLLDRIEITDAVIHRRRPARPACPRPTCAAAARATC